MPSQWLGSDDRKIAAADRAHRGKQRLHGFDFGIRLSRRARARNDLDTATEKFSRNAATPFRDKRYHKLTNDVRGLRAQVCASHC